MKVHSLFEGFIILSGPTESINAIAKEVSVPVELLSEESGKYSRLEISDWWNVPFVNIMENIRKLKVIFAKVWINMAVVIRYIPVCRTMYIY